jgi:hypothetical protein
LAWHSVGLAHAHTPAALLIEGTLAGKPEWSGCLGCSQDAVIGQVLMASPSSIAADPLVTAGQFSTQQSQ